MKIAVIGGGASGIATAIFSKRICMENSVTVFERSDRVLKKLLATGNGRCNLSNMDISPDNYFSRNPEMLSPILSAFTPDDERQFFESLGIMLCEENGRIYPYSRRANAVSDALRLECEHLGIKIRTGAFIKSIEKRGNYFSVLGETFDKVVISSGGMSAPSFGTDGNAFNLLKTFGHNITPTCYALSPVKVQEKVTKLKGIRAHCTVTLTDGGKTVKNEQGELQLTDYGLSGIAIMQISRLCKKGSVIEIDLVPEYDTDKFLSILKERVKALSHFKADDFLTGFLHKALGQYILEKCNINIGREVSSLTDNDLTKLAKTIKALSFTVESVLGKEQSQATCGGARLNEFNPVTLESNKVSGLYCTGEALDCVGDCGGYNLHWAWATAYIVGNGLNKNA